MAPEPGVAPAAQDVLHFWFTELEVKQHFAKDAVLDATIADRFGKLLLAAIRGELWSWRETAPGRLAEIILLDQFSRNIWRDTPRAFAQDPQALTLAQELAASGLGETLSTVQRSFAWIPFMHSESSQVHEQAVHLFAQPGLENTQSFAVSHRAIIDRFGRYPHRNAILGRESTAEEIEFLAGPGSSF